MMPSWQRFLPAPAGDQRAILWGALPKRRETGALVKHVPTIREGRTRRSSASPPPAFPNRLSQVLCPASFLSALPHLAASIQAALPHAPLGCVALRWGGRTALGAARAARRALPRRQRKNAICFACSSGAGRGVLSHHRR